MIDSKTFAELTVNALKGNTVYIRFPHIKNNLVRFNGFENGNFITSVDSDARYSEDEISRYEYVCVQYKDESDFNFYKRLLESDDNAQVLLGCLALGCFGGDDSILKLRGVTNGGMLKTEFGEDWGEKDLESWFFRDFIVS